MLIRGSFISDARGSVGGVTASRNRSGAYLRKRVKPTQVPSDPRSRARADLASQASAWTALTDAQRAAWNAVATTWTGVNKLGETIKLSGFNWFTKANATAALAGTGPFTTAPDTIPSTSLHPPTALVLDTSAHSVTATVDDTDPWAGDADGRLLVFMTQGQNPGRISPNGGFTFVASFPGNTTPVSSITTASLPVAVVEGRVYFFRFVALDADGRVSAEVIQGVTATP